MTSAYHPDLSKQFEEKLFLSDMENNSSKARAESNENQIKLYEKARPLYHENAVSHSHHSLFLLVRNINPYPMI